MLVRVVTLLALVRTNAGRRDDVTEDVGFGRAQEGLGWETLEKQFYGADVVGTAGVKCGHIVEVHGHAVQPRRA